MELSATHVVAVVAEPTDALSRLPPEHLQIIFDLSEAKMPLSRHLLPYTQRNLYRFVSLTDDKSLSRFSETCATHPSLGALVDTLDVIFFEADDEEEIESESAELIRLCVSLVALSELRIKNCRKFGAVVLSKTVSSRSLPSMTELALEDAMVDSPWSFSHYRNLANYPSLDTLDLISSPDADLWTSDDEDDDEEDEENWEDNFSIIDLSLHGALSNAAVASLVAHFSGVGCLSLAENDEVLDLSPVILRAPEELDRLHIYHFYDEPIHIPLDDALRRFTELVAPDWIRPEWTISFTVDDAREIVRVATAAGIKVGLGILEAIEIEEAYVAEELEVELRNRLREEYVEFGETDEEEGDDEDNNESEEEDSEFDAW